MKSEVVVPNVGESVTTGVLATWLKSDGETVSEGDEIFELETDKATLAVPAPASGVLSATVPEGTEVEIGQAVGSIDDAGAAKAGAADTGESESARPKADAEDAHDGAAPVLSPAVRRVVEEHGLDPEKIRATGRDGRITKEDAIAAAEKARDAKPAAAKPAAPARPSSTAVTGAGEQRSKRVPMSNLRKRIAANLVASKRDSAHLTTFNEVDMSRIIDIRTRYRETFEKKHGVRLGFMSFFVKACQKALEVYPEANAFIDGEDILYNDYYNIGVALSSERGLLTPVIRDVETKSFAEIESEIISFIERAKAKRLSPDELVGGTFTISNGGVFGSMLSTPIPNPPQTAVLGMHTIQKRAVVVDDQIVIRPMMYLALTYDHRMIDGREAIGFLSTVKNHVEDPNHLLLGL
ncbi:MAG: 2-oxoglutarate dehydrogenase complex dihydrolipoyllysine-residue succinyltransferase [Spirochaetaceae bacterium]|nr:MAG: 2-oxoglutarate dehydrogenase complex dihydrolipoyllysine-residue succinyltransferase [Spirochaetaceae bacterium]